jgi:hypothetical protein
MLNIDPSRNLLITVSLLDAVKWLQDCPSSWKERAFNGLNATVERIWTEPNTAIKIGMDFEKQVVGRLELDPVDFLRTFEHHPAGAKLGIFQEMCRGGEMQKVLKEIITVEEQPFCLYGKADVFFADRIIDIKTTSNWKGADSFKKKLQHKMYSYISGIPKFTYLVAEFQEFEGPGGRPDHLCVDVHRVDIEGMHKISCLEEIVDRIKDTVSFLQSDSKLLNAYLKKFCKY